MKKSSDHSLLFALAVALVLSAGMALKIGHMPISFSAVLSDTIHRVHSDAAAIFWQIRFPRVFLGILIGIVLGLSGAAMQGYLRNPLAEPGVLGVSGGAAFGAVLVFYSGISLLHPLALPFGGMAGAVISVLLLYILAGSSRSVTTLILSGVALNTLAYAGTALVLNLSKNPYARLEIVFWQLGSLQDRNWNHVFLAAPFMILGFLMLLGTARSLDALSLGEEVAQSMGVRMASLRNRILIGTALSVGAAVSVSGSIGFIGLMVPHLVRPLVRHEPGRSLLPSALVGAILLLWADIAVRLIPCDSELKLGVLTSIIGAPFFVYLVYKMKRVHP